MRPYKHRKKIDALLLWAMTHGPYRDSTDANRLTEFGLAVLREQYGDLCSEDCMRERAATFAGKVLSEVAARGPLGQTVWNAGIDAWRLTAVRLGRADELPGAERFEFGPIR